MQGMKQTSHWTSCPLSREVAGAWMAKHLTLHCFRQYRLTLFPSFSASPSAEGTSTHSWLSEIELKSQLNLDQSQSVSKIHAGNKNSNWQQESLHATLFVLVASHGGNAHELKRKQCTWGMWNFHIYVLGKLALLDRNLPPPCNSPDGSCSCSWDICMNWNQAWRKSFSN